MTPDEIVAEIYVRRGVVVIGAYSPFEVGAILLGGSGDWSGCDVPVRIVGPGTAEDYEAQCAIATELDGRDHSSTGPKLYYYRVEAVD